MLYGVNQRLRTEDVDSPLCSVRPVKTVLLVCITGDRGLCGGYNNFILKKVSMQGATWGGRLGELLASSPYKCAEDTMTASAWQARRWVG